MAGMNLLSRILPGVRIDDPVLGRLAPDDEGWAGEGRLVDGGQPFALTVHRSTGPSDADRDAYRSLLAEYEALRPEIEVALFTLWKAARAEVATEGASFDDAVTLWDAVSLQGVGIHPDGHVELVYGFDDEDHPEGAFFVTVTGDVVEPVEYVE